MNVPAAPETLSPELVLVSPPEVAALARRQLPDRRPAAVAVPAPRRSGALELAGVYLFCLLVTLGPLLLALITRDSSAFAH